MLPNYNAGPSMNSPFQNDKTKKVYNAYDIQKSCGKYEIASYVILDYPTPAGVFIRYITFLHHRRWLMPI